MRQTFIVIFLVLFISEISFAQVYKWIDDKGVVYFTDDITQVPEKYRPKAEKIGLPEDKEEATVQGESTPKKKEETYRDRLGRGEEYWKRRVEEWRKRLEELQVRSEALRLKYNELTEKFNDSKSSAERGSIRKEREQVKSEMDQNRIKIEEAKEMLEKKIPEEANLYKAKPEWVKQ